MPEQNVSRAWLKTLQRRTVVQQFMRFFVVGVAGFVVNASVVELCSQSGTSPLVAQALAFPLAATVTWWLNRRYTFGASRYTIRHEWLRYIIANALGWSVNNGTYFFSVLHFPIAYRYPAIAVATGSVAGMLLNFGCSKLVVFR